MTLLLIAFISVTFVYAYLYHLLFRKNQDEFFARLQIVYAISIAVIITSGILFFMGMNKYGTPRVDDYSQNRLIEHSGYYINPYSQFLFTGEVNGDGFEVKTFLPEDTLLLKPLHSTETYKHENWLISYRLNRYPFRIDNRCANITDEFWLRSGEEIYVIRKGGTASNPGDTTFFKLKWEIKTERSFREKMRALFGNSRIGNIYKFSQGVVKNGAFRPDPEFENDVVFSRASLREGLKLSILAQNIDTHTRNWSDIFDAITIVREIKNDRSSRIGLLVSHSLSQDGNIYFIKNGGQLPIGTKWIARDDTISWNVGLSYGLGSRDLFGIVLGNSVIVDSLNAARVSMIELDPPISWRLPPKPEQAGNIRFILTSASDYIPMPGYWFRSGRTLHPFYATGEYIPGQDRLRINDGKSRKEFSLDIIACIGDLEQGVVIKLTEPKQALPYAGAWSIAIVLLLLGLFLLNDSYVFRQAGIQPAPYRMNCNWSIIWACATVLLFVRVMLSYRISLFPPSDASPTERADIFDTSLLDSLAAFAVIPAGLIFVKFFIAIYNHGIEKYKKQYGAYVLSSFFIVWGTFFLQIGDWTGFFSLKYLAKSVFPVVIVVSLLPLLLRYLRVHIEKFIELKNTNIFWSYLPAVITAICLVLGFFAGTNESLRLGRFGIRISILTHILMVVSIAFALPQILRSNRRSNVNLYHIVLLSAALAIGYFVLARIGLNIFALYTVLSLIILVLWWKANVDKYRWSAGLSSLFDRLKTKSVNLPIEKLILMFFIGACLAFEMFLIKDNGFFIYSMGFVVAILATLLYGQWQTKIKKWLSNGYAWGIIAATTFVFLFTLPKIIPLQGLQEFVTPNNNIFYRFVSLQQIEEEIMLEGVQSYDLRRSSFLNNSHQNWQMLLYAAHSENGGVGYANAPLTDKGMNYPTTMSDCVYSIYFLSEHGWFAGWLLILIFLLLGVSGFYLASRIPDDQSLSYRIIPILMILCFFVFNALYMASANIGQLIFTGQNIPMLSLVSKSDLLQAFALLAVLTFLIFSKMEKESPVMYSNQSSIFQLNKVVIIAAVAWWFFYLGIGLFTIAGRDELKRDHDFKPELYRKLDQNIPIPEEERKVHPKAKPWRIKGLRIEETGVVRPSNVEKQYISQLNNRKNKFDAKGGLYYLSESYRGDKRIIKLKLNPYYFRLHSPFAELNLWPGKMIAVGDSSMPTVSALGYQFKVSLANNIGAKRIALDDIEPEISTINAVSLTRSKFDSRSFGELIREENALYFSPKRHSGWDIYLDSNILTEQKKYLLEQGSMLVIIDRLNRNNQVRRNLMYLGNQHPIVSYVDWRNGRMQRMFPLGAEFAMAYTLGEAADLVHRSKDIQGDVIKSAETIKLSVSISLHSKLSAKIAKIADNVKNEAIKRGHWDYARYHKHNIHASDRIALTVMDAYSGRILAMPDYPTVNPNQPDFRERIARATPSQQADLMLNHNLKNHAVGSTIKPIIFSTVASAFDSALKISDLSFYDHFEDEKKVNGEKATEHSELAGVKLSKGFKSQRSSTEPELVNTDRFLVRSRTHYESMLGMLGLIIDREQWRNAFIPITKTTKYYDVKYKGINYLLDITRVEGEQAITQNEKDKHPIPRTLAMKRTLLFSMIEQIFHVYNDIKKESAFVRSADHFFPSFSVDENSMTTSYSLQFSLPEPVILRPGDMQDIRNDYLQFLLGAADAGRWNNVVMAESMARLVTGQKVYATLEEPAMNWPEDEDAGIIAVSDLESNSPSQQDSVQVVDKTLWESLPSPLSDVKWRNRILFQPLEQVARAAQKNTPSYKKYRGTLSALNALSYKLQSKGLRLLCKTGTTNERDIVPGRPFQESEMLLFVLGKWNTTNKTFVKGKTITGFLYLEDVRRGNAGLGLMKVRFAKAILNTLSEANYFKDDPTRISVSTSNRFTSKRGIN